MNPDRFDGLARALIHRADRRRTLRIIGVGVIAPALAARARGVTATPAAPVQPPTCQTDDECPPAAGDACTGARCINHACTLIMVDCARGFVCCRNGACCPETQQQTAVGTTTAGAAQSWRTTAGPYRLDLVIGPPEPMYTPAQVATQHPTAGEVMLTGATATPAAGGMSGMAMATPPTAGTLQHLELHVTEAATGRVVTNAPVTIEIVDQTARRTTALPIVAMQGIKEGWSDFHYGNTVRLIPGHDYAIDVTVNGHPATFAFRFEPATPAPTRAATPPA